MIGEDNRRDEIHATGLIPTQPVYNYDQSPVTVLVNKT
jgi:hypothetical protein